MLYQHVIVGTLPLNIAFSTNLICLSVENVDNPPIVLEVKTQNIDYWNEESKCSKMNIEYSYSRSPLSRD